VKRQVLGLICAVIVGFSATHAAAYDYPLKNPYVATIIGTPTELQAELPEKIDYELLGLKVFPDRLTPDVFWYQQEFLYTLTYQKQEAPLIFVIAGTGSSSYSSSTIFLQKAFYKAGFHVICLSSPTHMNFVVTASATCVPGNIVEDAQDLYRVMTLAWQQVKDRIKVSEFYMAGIIGTVFQLALRNMIFTSDVMSNSGFIVPKNRVLGSADSLTDYWKVTGTLSFIDYFDELLYPYFQSKSPGLTKEALIASTSLRSIESYLRNTPKIVLMDNEDDLILTPQDLAFLKNVFGPRAKIYPYGGHLGNMAYKENIAHMINIFKN